MAAMAALLSGNGFQRKPGNVIYSNCGKIRIYPSRRKPSHNPLPALVRLAALCALAEIRVFSDWDFFHVFTSSTLLNSALHFRHS
jgi:hypothetical protein